MIRNKDLHSWIAKQQEKLNFSKQLFFSLMFDQQTRYIFFRLRYFYITSALFLIEYQIHFLIIKKSFEFREFSYILIISIITLILSNSIWGGLEQLRERIRLLTKEKGFKKINQLISKAVSWSLIASFFLIFSSLFVVFYIFSFLDIKIKLLIFYYLLKFSAGLPLITMHSAIFAVRRVYKPLVAILFVNLISYIFFILYWVIFEEWALIATFYSSFLVSFIISLFFITKAYKFSSWGKIRIVNVFSGLKYKNLLPFKEVLPPALSFLSTRMEWLLLYVICYGTTSTDNQKLGLALMISAPAFSSCIEWANIFYFDLKKLEGQLFRNIKKIFLSNLKFTAIIIPLIFGVLSSLSIFFIADNYNMSFYITLTLFFISRSLVALQQILLFVEKRYYTLFFINLLIATGYFQIPTLIHDSLNLLLVFTMLMLGMFLFINLYTKRIRFMLQSNYLPVPLLLRFFITKKTFSIIGHAKLARFLNLSVIEAMIYRFTKRLSKTCLITSYNKTNLIWIEAEDNPVKITYDSLSLHLPGLVEKFNLYKTDEASLLSSKLGIVENIFNVRDLSSLTSPTAAKSTIEYKRIRYLFEVDISRIKHSTETLKSMKINAFDFNSIIKSAVYFFDHLDFDPKNDDFFVAVTTTNLMIDKILILSKRDRYSEVDVINLYNLSKFAIISDSVFIKG